MIQEAWEDDMGWNDNKVKNPCPACQFNDDRYKHTCDKTKSTQVKQPKTTEEYTGGSVDYYKVNITNPTTESNKPYMAECNDIIEALGMNYAEGNAFKAIWRRCAQRTLGKIKAGAKDDGLYDAEKVVFFGQRLVEQSRGAK